MFGALKKYPRNVRHVTDNLDLYSKTSPMSLLCTLRPKFGSTMALTNNFRPNQVDLSSLNGPQILRPVLRIRWACKYPLSSSSPHRIIIIRSQHFDAEL